MYSHIKSKFINQPLILLFILGVIYGTVFSISRFVIRSGVTAVDYSFLLAFVPALILIAYLWHKDLLNTLISNNPKHYFLVGLYGIVIPNTNKYWLAAHVPSGILAIIIATTPFFIYPIALICKEERFRINRLAGVLLSGVGILLLVLNQNIIGIQIDRWLIISLITPMSYAFGAVYVARYTPKDYNIVMLTTGMLVCSALMLFPFLFLEPSAFHYAPFLQRSVDFAILLEMMLITVGYIFLFKIIKYYGSINYSAVNGISAIIGVFWGWLLFHEVVSGRIIWAAICVIGGAILITTKRFLGDKEAVTIKIEKDPKQPYW